MVSVSPASRHRRISKRVVSAAILAGGIVIYAYGSVRHEEGHQAQPPASLDMPVVDLVKPKPQTVGEHLVLPADVEAYYKASIHAQVDGYVKIWFKDIGAKVKAGDILAQIDTPDLDQRLKEAQGQLARAKVDLTLAELTWERWKALRASQAVSEQTAAEKEDDALAKKANVDAAQARVDRIEARLGFKNLIAPFDGIVTARRIDIGALVANNDATDPGLFDVAMVNEMRIYIRVPQANAKNLREGMAINLQLPQFPSRIFKGTLVTTSGAFSRESRAQLTELKVENPGQLLTPGSYATADIGFPPDPHKLSVPASAIIYRDLTPELAAVDQNAAVTLKPVEISVDRGTTIDIESGISENDHIIANPPNAIMAGDAVKIATIDGKAVADSRK